MYLIITEKPDQAKDIANGLGKPSKENGYFKVDDYFVTWAFGHLFTIDDNKYRSDQWALDELPLLPNDFKYIPIEDKKNQIFTIYKLIKDASKIIVATDAGREGELIAREILVTFSGSLPPCFRFWTSEALTPAVVKKFINDVKPLSDYDSLFLSAKARQISDWVVGINLTRLFSIKGKGLWSVGRVQTPSLSIIVNRDNTIGNFKPVPYSNVILKFEKDKTQFFGKLHDTNKEKNQDRFTSEEAKQYHEKLKDCNIANVTNVVQEEKRKNPPPLYSLTLLQRAANRKFGYSAKDTLALAQSLYEKHKCTSYPRTESRYLAESSREMAKDLLSKFNPNLTNKVDSVGKRVFDDSKLTDHHAIIPLADYSGNDEKELKIFNLIKNAFIAAFMDDYIFESTKVELNTDNCNLPIYSSGNRVVSMGWKTLYANDNEKDDQEDGVLPNLVENDSVDIKDVSCPESMTKPPAYINEDSLLGQMEKLNLGTPATRDSIIEKLISTNFISRDKKNLRATDKGIELINKLDGSDVANAELTSNWENELDDIYRKKKGEAGLKSFISEIHNFTKSEVEKFKDIEVTNHNLATPKMIELAKKLAKEDKVNDFDKDNKSFEYIKKFIDLRLTAAKETTPCPCGKGEITNSPRAWNCEGCNSTIWKEIAGKKISFDSAIKLLKGETIKIEGFKSKKTKKKFSANIKLVDGKVKFEF